MATSVKPRGYVMLLVFMLWMRRKADGADSAHGLLIDEAAVVQN